MSNDVFREITINWNGRDYKVTPNMALLRSIEMGDISFVDIALRTSQGRAPLSHIATVVAKLLQSAGAKVTDEQAYFKLKGGGTEKEISSLISAAMQAFAPEIGSDTEGNKTAARTPAKK